MEVPNDGLGETAREFVITGQRESEHRGNARSQDDRVCEGSGDDVLHSVECVIPREDGLAGGPAVG